MTEPDFRQAAETLVRQVCDATGGVPNNRAIELARAALLAECEADRKRQAARPRVFTYRCGNGECPEFGREGEQEERKPAPNVGVTVCYMDSCLRFSFVRKRTAPGSVA